jgi:hypothetical protein
VQTKGYLKNVSEGAQAWASSFHEIARLIASLSGDLSGGDRARRAPGVSGFPHNSAHRDYKNVHERPNQAGNGPSGIANEEYDASTCKTDTYSAFYLHSVEPVPEGANPSPRLTFHFAQVIDFKRSATICGGGRGFSEQLSAQN